MAMRGCPVTGRIMHRFDPQTHRCACGRWERGFKPKRDPVLPRAECQICECDRACDTAGNLLHHGYQRPGWGVIEGDCFGVGYHPYPATDALEAYLKALDARLERLTARLAALPLLTEYPYVVEYAKRLPERGIAQSVTIIVKRGDEYHYDHERRFTIPGFTDLIVAETRRLDSDIERTGRERDRVIKRIAAANSTTP